jgi:hypothetical protein
MDRGKKLGEACTIVWFGVDCRCANGEVGGGSGVLWDLLDSGDWGGDHCSHQGSIGVEKVRIGGHASTVSILGGHFADSRQRHF